MAHQGQSELIDSIPRHPSWRGSNLEHLTRRWVCVCVCLCVSRHQEYENQYNAWHRSAYETSAAQANSHANAVNPDQSPRGALETEIPSHPIPPYAAVTFEYHAVMITNATPQLLAANHQEMQYMQASWFVPCPAGAYYLNLYFLDGINLSRSGARRWQHQCYVGR